MRDRYVYGCLKAGMDVPDDPVIENKRQEAVTTDEVLQVDLINRVEIEIEKNDISKNLDDLVFDLISSPFRGQREEFLTIFRDQFKRAF